MIKAAMKKVVRVRDVMTEAVVFLRTTQTLDDAWAALHQHGIRGAPVLDEHGRLAGVLSTADLADPRHRPPWANGTVQGAMTRLLFAVRADDPVIAAVRLMIDEDIHRAVVVNEDGSVAGIIAPMDVLRAVAKCGLLADGGGQEDPPVRFVDLRRIAARA